MQQQTPTIQTIRISNLKSKVLNEGLQIRPRKIENRKYGNLQKEPSVSMVHDNIFSALSSDDDEGMETDLPL